MILCVPVIGGQGEWLIFCQKVVVVTVGGCIIMANGRRELAGLGRH